MKTRLFLPIFLLFAVFVSPAPGGTPASAPPDSWEPWSARPELMPDTRSSEGQWHVASGGGPSCQGGWDLHWKNVVPGEWYAVSARCTDSGVPHVHDNAHAELICYTGN